MDHSTSEQSFSDHSTDAGCSQPSTASISDAIALTFGEADAFTLPTEIQPETPLSNGCEADQTSQSSDEIIPLSSDLIPSNINDQIRQLPGAYETVPQVISTIEERPEQMSTAESQPSENSIDHLYLPVQLTTISKILLGTVKPKKISKRKQNWIKISIPMDDEDEIEKPLKPSPDDYIIPKGSTEFVHDNATFPVSVNQLYGKPIGHGGFGSVYSVDLTTPHRLRMAVKRVPRTDTSEVKILETVTSGDCPNIIEYYCTVIHPDTNEMCICMEFMDTSLYSFYQTMCSLNQIPDGILDCLLRRILHNCATALFHLEIKGIVHRDIKPHNILINQNGVIKLCDFGISVNFEDIQSDTTVERGSEHYIPPCRARSIKDDMWALGITLLEIIMGRNPFLPISNEDFPSKIGWHPPPLPNISQELQDCIMHLLQHDPQHRPRSYRDILNWPCIKNVPEMLPNEEFEFVRYIIGQIPPPEKPNW